MQLQLGKCCGTCKHINKPKTPEAHAAHYTVAKTMRWCYKHNVPTMREACCGDDGYEQMEGRCSPKSNLGRAHKQGERLSYIRGITRWMENNHIEALHYYDNIHKEAKEPYCTFKIVYGKLTIGYYYGGSGYLDLRGPSDVDKLKKAIEQYHEKKGDSEDGQ